MTITQLSQQASTDDVVTLYTLDTTSVGGAVYRFTSSAFEASAVQFDGETYTPVPIETSGWEWNGNGSLPQPKVRLANIDLALTSAISDYDDLVGCEFTRLRTFRRYLDGEAEADPTAYFPPDVYLIEQKTAHNKVYVEWVLSARFDQQGVMLPRRQILQNACSHTYRVWNGSNFVYTSATCPYTGSTYYDAAGNLVTNPAQDRCGKKLSDCQKRFGNDPLPTRAFPGVARVRV